MTTETTVTRFVDKKDLDFPHPTLVKANEEEDDYVWQRAGNGHYACKHDDTAHTIIEKDGTIGCSCGDWTHRCKGVEGCKHVAAFLHRKNPPAAKLDKRIAMDLIAAGWKKTEHGNLYPPDHESTAEARDKDVEAAMGAGWQKGHPEPEVIAELPPVIPPDPDLDLGVEDPLPNPEPYEEPDPDLDQAIPEIPEPPNEDYSNAKVTVTCQYCKMGAIRKDQEAADAWLKKHEAGCSKNPANAAITLCRFCEEDIHGKNNEDVMRALVDHEAMCPKNPANQKATPSQGMMSATCQYCGKTIKRKLAADLKLALEIHEESCTERPKEQKPGVKKMFPEFPEEEKKMEESTTALSTGQDMPDEREFTNRKVKNYIENRGGFYKATGGKEVPDSAAMSIYALDTCRISTETILIEKNGDQAKAIVRGYKGGVSVDASVILRFEVLRRRELLKMAKKYPKAILDWSDQLMPNLDLKFMLKDRTPMITLGEHMINFAIDQEQFAERTAETLARRRTFDMLTGVDWRDSAEIAVEDADAASMDNKKV